MKIFAKSGLAIAVSLACFSASAEQMSTEKKEQKGIERIVVTGQKIANTLQETKESVVVFTEASLEERNLADLTDVFLQTPGVSGNKFGFRIRGVRNSDSASLPNRGDLASTVIDGVTLSGWVKSEAAGQLWDVNQVEVLRGPQSTNLGRNALAGAVVVNTVDPTFENEGKVRLGFGEYGRQEIKGVANFNLVDDVSAIRFAVEQNESDGYVTNITRDEDDYAHANNNVYRVKWLYQPSDNFKSVFSYQRIESEYGRAVTYLVDGYDKEDRVTPADADSTFNTDADLFSLNIDYDINDNWYLKSISAYQKGERVRFNDADNTATPVESGGGLINRQSEDNNWSQEFRFNYESEGIRGSSGVYFSGIEAKRSQTNTINYNLPVLFDEFMPGLGAVLTTNAVLPIALYEPFFPTINSGKTNVDTSTWAIFSEWEFDLNENWIVNAGLRYDNEKQEYLTASITDSTYALPQMGGTFGGVDLGGVTIDQVIFLINSQLTGLVTEVPETAKTEDFSNLLPHAGITYKWNDDVSTSFFVKKSYRSGGSELTLLNGINNFDAEELWNYEASLRAVILDGKGVFNANVYYSNWTDQQVAITEPGTTNDAFTMTVNAGESNLSGAEVSFSYEISNNFDLYTGLAISHTEYDNFVSPDGSEDYSGNDFSFAPKETGVIGLRYADDNGFFGNVNVSYTGDSYSNVDNTRELDSYTLVNFNGGYEFDKVKLEVYVRNLTDELYATNNNITSSDGTPGVILGAPREAGAKITYSF
ncbi:MULTISPECIES: TonB-dependent receptor [unclassified Pseudoalteromonas]|uniref:TonB-dependent receptor n=1 Tax=unclassified Pseudoalteromonas TaxID=194690 RepID=UPI0005A7E497|nr:MULTISPECIES: TonB-dependent receptor [unclassified Pseudoalteromonas]